jgi:tetratricopeptide (TPR) repeat protein
MSAKEPRARALGLFLTLALAAALTAVGCAKKEAPAPAADAGAAPANDGKIPISTTSPEAKAEFVQGRDMVDKLLITDSLAHFRKAVELDPSFAWAELMVAQNSPTGTEFFEHLNKAVALAEKASNGERLLILAAQAGANANAVRQKQYLDDLLAAYPNDERANFAVAAYYFGQLDYPKAIEHYKKATEINNTFSTAYNLLGYAYRQQGDYPDAEKSFQRYIELIPKDPNPYDSYAELLLKMGRYDESIAQYRKALEIDPNFLNAYQGIAMALLYQGKPAEAAAELKSLVAKARTDGERRTGMFAETVLLVDSGKPAAALASLDEQYELGKKTNDVAAMAFDNVQKGNILLDLGKPDQAKKEFEAAASLVQASNLPQEFKDNNALALHANLARVALAKKDWAAAKAQSDEFRNGAAAGKNPFQARLAHELDGTLALAQKDWDRAIAELEQANLQNPQNLFRLCQAYKGKGDAARSKDFCKRAAEFNSLPSLNYALIRAKAGKAS